MAFGSRLTSRVCGCRTAVASHLFHVAGQFSFFSLFFIYIYDNMSCIFERDENRGSGAAASSLKETLALVSTSAWLSLFMHPISGVVLISFMSLCGRPRHNLTAPFIVSQQIYLFIENKECVTFQCKQAGSEPVANFHLQSPGRSTTMHKLNINRNKKIKAERIIAQTMRSQTRPRSHKHVS